MSFAFDFDRTNGILRSRLIGNASDDVLKDFFQTGAQYAIRTQPKVGIVDLSETTSFDVSARVISELAKSPPVLKDPNVRRVVIAPSPETYGMMRMFEMEAEVTRPFIHVVRTEREAWAILGLEKPRFEPLDIEST
jgi:hypothetical protein